MVAKVKCNAIDGEGGGKIVVDIFRNVIYKQFIA